MISSGNHRAENDGVHEGCAGDCEMNMGYRNQKWIKRTGAKLFENDGERGCRCTLIRKIWVVPWNFGENEEHVKDARDQNRGCTHHSSQLVGYSRGRKEVCCRMRQLRGEGELYSMVTHRQNTNLTTRGMFLAGFSVSPAVMPRLSVPPSTQRRGNYWFVNKSLCGRTYTQSWL